MAEPQKKDCKTYPLPYRQTKKWKNGNNSGTLFLCIFQAKNENRTTVAMCLDPPPFQALDTSYYSTKYSKARAGVSRLTHVQKVVPVKLK